MTGSDSVNLVKFEILQFQRLAGWRWGQQAATWRASSWAGTGEGGEGGGGEDGGDTEDDTTTTTAVVIIRASFLADDRARPFDPGLSPWPNQQAIHPPFFQARNSLRQGSFEAGVALRGQYKCLLCFRFCQCMTSMFKKKKINQEN